MASVSAFTSPWRGAERVGQPLEGAIVHEELVGLAGAALRPGGCLGPAAVVEQAVRTRHDL